ncbi:hypothetical protein LINPERHAP2_LOCUS34765 [Linum perenne]
MKKAISSASTVDRISELPEEIIHGILARLESHESAARTSILSKRWLRLWSTFPFVECKGDISWSKYKSFAAATCKRMLAAVPPIPLDSFTIELPNIGDCDPVIHQLLPSVAGGRSSPIKVVVRLPLFFINSRFRAPIEEGGMVLNFSRTKFLDLLGLDLSKLPNFKLDNLHELSLENVRVCRKSFLRFLANAPRLKVLRMERIFRIDHIITLDNSASNFPSLPFLLDSFTLKLTLRNRDNLHNKGLDQLLSLVSVGPSSPIKVVVNNNRDSYSHDYLEGEMLLNCGRTKFLDLTGFDLSRLHCFETCLDNLQELSLDHILVSEQSFPSCLAEAPRLEKLKWVYVRGIDSLDVSASNFPSLVSLEFEGYASYLQQLQLSSDTVLRTLSFTGGCECLKVVTAPSVKTVYFTPLGEFGRSELEKLISKFPSLESLYVDASYIQGDSKLRVSSRTLQELTFKHSVVKHTVSKMEFEIDTPNLATLTIDTTGSLKINSTVVNVPPSCRCVLDCHMFEGRISTSWFIKLSKCLAALAPRFRQLVFQLDISYSTKVSGLDLSRVGHECAPLAVRHLLMGTDFRDFRGLPFEEAHRTRLLDGLLWTLHPKALSVAMSSSDTSLSSYISEQIEMKNLEKCCSNGKCWRHQFKDAKITSVMVDDVSTIDESVISQPSIDIAFLIIRYRVITGTRRKKMKKEISSASTVDRISELPEEIIHGILARLDSHESAARTSILSKRWLRLWSTFPFVEFKRYYEREEILQRKFQSFAAATSKRLLAAVPPLPLESFNIELILDPDQEQLRQCLHQLLSSVPGGRSSPIKVVVRITLYRINSSVLAPIEGGMLLNFSRTKFLDLTGFDLSGLQNFENCHLDNLQELSLGDVRVCRQSFPIFLANAPHLKELRMARISEIDHTLDISASNFPSSPLLLDSFTINLQPEDNLRQGLYQLLSLLSVGVDDGGRSSPIKVVVKNNEDISASLEGGMLLTCGRTKFLDLKGFDLSRLHRYETCLDDLQELSLEHIRVSKQSFPSCLANAPRLEKLKLQYILGIDSLDISASNFPSLVSLEFEGNSAQQLQLSSDTILQTLYFQSRCNLLKLVSAPSVKTVNFSPVGELSRSELEKLISKFPSLESLSINGPYSSNSSKLRVSSHTLRELSFTQSISKMELEIDTPNLTTLTIHTNSELKINSTVVNVHPSCRCVFDCALLKSRITTSWFIKLRKCLAVLAARFRQLVFKLDVCYLTKTPRLDLRQVGHECAPLAVRHLLMGIDFRNSLKEAHKTGLLDGLLWTVHPKALSVAMSSSDSSLFSYISEQIEMKNLEKCCSNGKCWRHQFKGAKITSVTVDDVSTVDESVISQPSIDMVFLITRGRYVYYS